MNNLARNLIKKYRLFSNVAPYKSAISLENLYPNSSLKLTTPSQSNIDQNQRFTGYIPVEQLDITYSRSSGPGGQNVNKVNTKVEVRFDIQKATWIPADIKPKLYENLKSRITKEGFLIFRSDLTRSQQLNLADCLEKIRTTLRNCYVEQQQPSEESMEKARRRLERATRERLAIKRQRSQIKSDRQSPLV